MSLLVIGDFWDHGVWEMSAFILEIVVHFWFFETQEMGKGKETSC